MNGAFYIAATGLRSQQSALDVTANNIANLNTPGFKRVKVRFSELVSPTGAPTLGGAGVTPSGVSADSAQRVFTQGDLRDTGGAMDLAIRGDGFIELMGPSGRSLLWRGGALKVDEEGFLAASNGMALRAMIAVPTGADDLKISADGRVTASLDGQAPSEIGRIDLAMVRDAESLTATGDGVFELAENGAVTSVGAGEGGGGVFVQGASEASNV